MRISADGPKGFPEYKLHFALCQPFGITRFVHIFFRLLNLGLPAESLVAERSHSAGYGQGPPTSGTLGFEGFRTGKVAMLMKALLMRIETTWWIQSMNAGGVNVECENA